MEATDRNDEASNGPDAPEFDRLKALLMNTNERIDAGEDSTQVTSEAHELLDPGGD